MSFSDCFVSQHIYTAEFYIAVQKNYEVRKSGSKNNLQVPPKKDYLPI